VFCSFQYSYRNNKRVSSLERASQVQNHSPPI
jgi:hypothetical protein